MEEDHESEQTKEVAAAESSSSSSKRKLKGHSLKTKLEAIEFAKTSTVSAAARRFGVSRSSVQDWRRQENELHATIDEEGPSAAKKQRLAGGGRKPLSANMEAELYEWIEVCLEKKQQISRHLIRLKAQELGKNLAFDGKPFKATEGWLDNFMSRYELSLCVPTTTAQKTPVESMDKLVSFVLYIRQLRQKENYNFADIYAADETAVWLDPTGIKTVAKKGSRSVTVLSTGHEKMRVTVLLCARANGAKVKPFILLPRKRPIPDILKRFSSRLHLCWCGSNWMNQDLTLQFLQKVFGGLSFCRKLLVWDAFKCHLTEETKVDLRKKKVDAVVVPSGCTKFVRAPDVCWNAPFKKRIHDMYEDWMTTAEKSYTPAGNMRAPPMEVYLQWIVDAWDNLDEEMIAKSFKVCGITNIVDGSEDNFIHVFSSDGECQAGLQLLKERAMTSETLAYDEKEENEESDLEEIVVLP